MTRPLVRRNPLPVQKRADPQPEVEAKEKPKRKPRKKKSD